MKIEKLIRTLLAISIMFVFGGCCESFFAFFDPPVPTLPQPMMFDPEYMVEYDTYSIR